MILNIIAIGHAKIKKLLNNLGVAVRESECEENGGSGTKPVPGWQKYGALRYEISKGTRHHHRDGWCSKKPHSSFFAPRCTKLGGIDQQQQQRKFSIANFVREMGNFRRERGKKNYHVHEHGHPVRPGGAGGGGRTGGNGRRRRRPEQ